MAYEVPVTRLLDKPILQGLQQSNATAMHEVGTIVTSADGKQFEYVYMECSGVACYSGRPMVWVDGTTDYLVTPDCSDAATGNAAGGSGGFAGVATMNLIDEDNAYIWIQTKGIVQSAIVSSAVALNDALIPEAEDCFDDLTTYHTSATSTHWKVIGHALTVATTGIAGLHSCATIMLL